MHKVKLAGPHELFTQDQVYHFAKIEEHVKLFDTVRNIQDDKTPLCKQSLKILLIAMFSWKLKGIP